MIFLDRFKFVDDGTFGMLTDEGGNQLCFTCELPWDDNKPDMSCIPNGTYECETYSSVKFPDVWKLMNVPGRDNILIHNGNNEDDTHGCIIVGDRMGHLNGKDAVLNSISTLVKLKSILPYSFELTVTGDNHA